MLHCHCYPTWRSTVCPGSRDGCDFCGEGPPWCVVTADCLSREGTYVAADSWTYCDPSPSAPPPLILPPQPPSPPPQLPPPPAAPLEPCACRASWTSRSCAEEQHGCSHACAEHGSDPPWCHVSFTPCLGTQNASALIAAPATSASVVGGGVATSWIYCELPAPIAARTLITLSVAGGLVAAAAATIVGFFVCRFLSIRRRVQQLQREKERMAFERSMLSHELALVRDGTCTRPGAVPLLNCQGESECDTTSLVREAASGVDRLRRWAEASVDAAASASTLAPLPLPSSFPLPQHRTATLASVAAERVPNTSGIGAAAATDVTAASAIDTSAVANVADVATATPGAMAAGHERPPSTSRRRCSWSDLSAESHGGGALPYRTTRHRPASSSSGCSSEGGAEIASILSQVKSESEV